MTLNISSGPPRAATGPAPAHRTWAPLAVMLTGTFMIVLDFFIVNVAIPSIQRGLHTGPAGIEWVVTAYGLTYGVGLITGGRLGDRYGRRRMFVTGLAVFTLASLACGLAGNAAVLIISRAVQGIGAAVAGPQTLSLIGVTYEGRRRVTAITAYGVTLGLAAVLGQLFGGLLIRANVLGLDWRSCFLVNLPVGVAALVATPRLVAESRGNSGDRIDLVGTVLVTAGLVAIILPLVDGRQQHWPAWSWACLAAAVPILAGFAAHQTWRMDPAVLRSSTSPRWPGGPSARAWPPPASSTAPWPPSSSSSRCTCRRDGGCPRSARGRYSWPWAPGTSRPLWCRRGSARGSVGSGPLWAAW